jgi:coenzyme F420-reducing hydrogenase alpha subunit
VVEGALALKKAGNELMRVVGGREIHPINVRVGGFYRAPSRAELQAVVPQLTAARDFARSAIDFLAGLPFPEMEEEYELVALTEPDEYAIEAGRLQSSSGLDLAPAQYEEHFVESHVEHSTALHSRLRSTGGAYLVGPVARWALAGDRLPDTVRAAAESVGLERHVTNPFRSILVRGVEILFAFEEALRIIDAYAPPDPPFVEVQPRPGVGHGWSEAPRGMLWHSYRIDEGGTILDAKIVPPTSQNQARIEETMRGVVERHMALEDEALRVRCESAIRSYDPCISCSTHFLNLTVDRG